MRMLRSWKNSLMITTLLAALYILNIYLLPENSVSESSSDALKEWTRCDCPLECPANISSSSLHSNIDCLVDQTRTIKCIQEGHAVFIPFNFIKQHFDVTGRLKDGHFEWQTSYSKIKIPDGTYDPQGPFGHFSTYNVQTRDRVRCINPISGVPMSTQWDSTPYYYPIQIAQYGLQFFSRLKEREAVGNGNEEEVKVGVETKEWKGTVASLTQTSQRTFLTAEDGKKIVNISTESSLSNPGVYLYLSRDTRLTILSFRVFPYSENSSFSILVSVTATKQTILLNFIPEADERCVWKEERNSMSGVQTSFSYSLPWSTGSWFSVTRDILADVSRALATEGKSSSSFHSGDISLISIGFRGSLAVGQPVRQRAHAHQDFFLAAADWFLSSQDSSGGWPVPVERSIADRRLILASGWHSSMAQGHGLSLLSRAFIFTQREKYLRAAEAALSLFHRPASEGGVRNLFLGVTPWYEEYPTSPGTFVLNGFLYSLLGLYDLSRVEVSLFRDNASSLWEEGLSSLHQLLPLYDTGSRSTYDLRHVALNSPPNLARWDYHAVHVYLLKWIVSITGDKKIDEVAERWIGYAHGKTAKHN